MHARFSFATNSNFSGAQKMDQGKMVEILDALTDILLAALKDCHAKAGNDAALSRTTSQRAKQAMAYGMVRACRQT